jgi:hypothetical protein
MNYFVRGLALSSFREAARGLYLLVFLAMAATSLGLHGCSGADSQSSATSSSGYTIYLSVSKSSILSDDVDNAQINATVLKGSLGQAGVNVTFSSTGGRLNSTSATTNANGKASVAITSGPKGYNQTITITAAIDGATTSAPLQVTGGNNLTIYLSASKSSILSDDTDSAQINATVLNGSVGQADVKVTFSTTGGRLDSATATTGANGKASVAITSGPRADNQTVTITAAIDGASASVPLQITGGNNLTMGAITLGANPLSAYGTTGISVNVLNNDVLYSTPVNVSFSSPCATAGKANLTPSTATINGVATASYVDNACAGSDIVTASITDGPSKSATLKINAPDSGAITFVSASPSTITLRGTGGAGSSEFSRVIFRVVDSAGNPIGGKTVSLALSTNVGGITLSTPTTISDANTGQVSVDVHAGVVGTPVRVTATTLTDAGTILSTQSNALVISTGFPDQDSTSLSVEKFNIEGRDFDGITTTLTMRLADHFNNPVPDGTAVFFTTEGGSITPSCTTTNGACSATLTSQNPRPDDGRVTVLAYAIGEESFNDLDGDGLADLVPNEIVEDLPEAWLDTDHNGFRDPKEPFIDFNNNGIYDGPDGKFNTNLCNETPDPLTPTRVSSPGSCGTQKTIHVRRDTEIVFSGSSAVVSPGALTLSSCAAIDGKTIAVTDIKANPLPAGTTIDLTASGDIWFSGSGGIVNTTSFEVGNSNQTGISNITDFSFAIVTGKILGSCASGDSGSIEVKVTTPSGATTTKLIGTSVL